MITDRKEAIALIFFIFDRQASLNISLLVKIFLLKISNCLYSDPKKCNHPLYVYKQFSIILYSFI